MRFKSKQITRSKQYLGILFQLASPVVPAAAIPGWTARAPKAIGYFEDTP